MTDFNTKLQALSEKCARKKKLEAELEDLYMQRRELQDKTCNLKSIMWSEQSDVDRLEGRSLYALFHFLTGKKEEMLTKEKEEAYAAKVKYDTAEAELDSVLSDIKRYRDELQELRNCEIEYAAVLKEKASALKDLNSEKADEIIELEEQIRVLENLKREIREAMSAGQGAKNQAGSVLASLSKAKDWSTYDMIAGDGIISHVAKHNHLNNAQAEIEQLQVQLRRFRTELVDIKISADMKVNVDGFLGFADYFFDGIIVDWTVRKKINNSLDEVQRIKTQIENVLRKLSGMFSSTDRKLEELKTKYNEIIVKS
ncbi:MAG: hypothetical protein IJ017_04720 [Oscillospiraceae bacterium]|nr:hypothetical protein [Oscillospiraceae bacterium]